MRLVRGIACFFFYATFVVIGASVALLFEAIRLIHKDEDDYYC